MRLSDYFRLQNKQNTTGGSRSAPVDSARSSLINRQIRALTPGQTISGEILSRNGGEVQIKLSEDLVLHARLEQNMNLELGRNMTFEVKNNGASLTLSPLFANTATDANLLKALDMASLPVNQTTVAMTGALMEAGLPIDKNTLQQVYREIGMHPQSELGDIVGLHRLGLEVNEGNLRQLASYKNLTHQLVNGMNNILEELPLALQAMAEGGNLKGAVQLLHTLLGLASSQEGGEAGGETLLQGQGGAMEDSVPMQGSTAGYTVMSQEAGEGTSVGGNSTDVLLQLLREAAAEGGPSAGGTAAGPDQVSDSGNPQGTAPGQILTPQEGQNLAAQLHRLLTQLELPEGEYQQWNASLQLLAQGGLSGNDTAALAAGLLQQTGAFQGPDGGRMRLTAGLSELLSGKELGKLLTQTLKDQWTMLPRDVSRETVDSLYQKLNRQLHILSDALESAGQSGGNAARGVTNMTQNLDFLQQLNQMYTYVQLPLKMGGREAHGDLYVYTNKKHLASGDGSVSALLHLDMEHLGPVDVYVAMQSSHVSTRFYVSDDSMLDFLSEHMDILTDRLRDRGYEMKCEMNLQESKGEARPVINEIIEENSSNSPLVQYAFDVRA